MMESKQDQSDQMVVPQIPKSKHTKLVKPNVPIKPTFLKKQNFNKASNKKLMLITNKDGDFSLITSTNAPPIAPKPRTTVHVRVQQLGRKLQVCPIGHFVQVQPQGFEVCSVQNELTWSSLQKKANKNNIGEESCRIDYAEKHNKSLANIPTPAPRNRNAKRPNALNPDQSSPEVRKSFESIRSNFEAADMHHKPVPSPRGGVNVKLQRVLFEKLLHSKEGGIQQEQSVSDNPIQIHLNQNLASGQAGTRMPKNIPPVLTSKSSSKAIPPRLTSEPSFKALPTEPTSKPSSKSLASSPRDIPSEPTPKALSSELAPKPVHREIPTGPTYESLSSELTPKASLRDIPSEPTSKARSSELIPKPSPRNIPPDLTSKARSSQLTPKPSPRVIPLEPTSKSLSKALPPELSTKALLTELPSKALAPELSPKDIPSELSSMDIPSNMISKPSSKDIPSEPTDSTDTFFITNQEATSVCAKLDIPEIIIMDEENTNDQLKNTSHLPKDDTFISKDAEQDESVSLVYLDCEHLADLILVGEDNNFDIKNQSNGEICMDDVKPEICTNVESETYTDVKPDSDINEGEHFDEQSDSDIDDHEYVNYNCDDKDHNQYVNVGDFSDTTTTPSGEYIILQNYSQTTPNGQSTITEDTLSDVTADDLSDITSNKLATPNPQDHTYINYSSDILHKIQTDDSDSKHPVGSVDKNDLSPLLSNTERNDGEKELDNLDEAAMESQCYEVILDISSLQSHTSTKYRRFSCRQPGKRRRSNFKKQSVLNVNTGDEGSDFKSSQEDLKEFSNDVSFENLKAEEEVIEYTKDEFEDDEEEEEDEGWQSIDDSSDLDHDDEDTHSRKRSFQHVLSITPEPVESGVSSGNPSPSRLSSATSDSQVTRITSCVSCVSSDGFEDGSVRSSLSQFSLSDELEGINNCDSFEEDEFTDKEYELLEILKRESTLSDGVQDVEALKNDTMEHINKMRQKLAEMKRNVALKKRQCVSLVSDHGFDLPENSKQSDRTVEVSNDLGLISDSNNSEPGGSGENTTKCKLKEIGWKQDLSHASNHMKNSQDDNRADLQEESVESAIYISADLDDEANTTKFRRSVGSYVDPDELTTTPRHQSLRRMEHRTSWRPGADGAPPIPPRTPSLKLEQQTPNPSVHKTHSAGPVLQTQTKRSKKDSHFRRQSRFVRKEPLFQAYNKDAKLRDTLHLTGNRRRRLSTGRDSPPPLPPPRRQSSVNSKSSQPPHLMPERRSLSFPEIDVENVNRKPSLKMQRTLWCEVPEVLESGILDQIDDKARKLQEAMFEVITSEASYLRSLDIFMNNFMKADVLSVSYGLLRKEERHHLFSNLLSVRDASERLLLDLEDRFQETYLISEVCDIIIKHATQRNFDMYVTYCLNNQYQIKTLKSLKENPIFVTELGILERSKECGGNNLLSFIMMPFQRITRLPLLIDAIISRLEPTSQQIGPATEALNLVKKVATKCNEEARRMEGIEELTKLAHKLDYKPNIKAIKISDKLLIVKRGDLQWFSHDTSRFTKKKVVSKQIHILVFADKVVLTKRKIKNDREVFEVFDWCQRNLVDVKAVELKYDALPEQYKNVMMVVFLQNHEKKEKKYFINTTSDANFQRWSDALAPPNRSDQGESIYESWDCPQVMCIQAYNAQEPDELSMEESDVVDVLRKSEGWWEGMRVRDSAKGWFPANHVQEIVNDHVRARNLKHRYKVLSVCQEQLEKLQMQGKDMAF